MRTTKNSTRLPSWREDVERELSALRASDRFRSLQTFACKGGWVQDGDRRLLNLAGNDYLGFADAAGSVAETLGRGAGASRLVCGNHAAHAALETAVADWLGAEAAVSFGCGYMANVGVLQALASRGDALYCDRLNHASLVDGAILSRAQVFRYGHCDVDHLRRLLSEHAIDGRFRRQIIVTESLFSMDGDFAPLAEIADLARAYGALLVVDEAHAVGIVGAAGAGGATAAEIAGEDVVRVAAFGKAFGAYGACVAGCRPLMDLIVNRARTLIYTTGLPPALAETLTQRCREIRDADDLRRRLSRLVVDFRAALAEAGLPVSRDGGPIIPIVVGGDGAVMAVAQQLREAGILTVGIRPPTVPEGTARLRLTVSALHDPRDLRAAAGVIADAYRQVAAA